MDVAAPELRDIEDAIGLLQMDQPRGRARLLELWRQLESNGTPLQRCVLAHFLADTETETASELEWDLRALEAATGNRDVVGGDALPSIPEGFLPSLHLSVAEGHRRSGDLARARGHALLASRHLDALSDDGYGRMIRGGLLRLQAALADEAR